MTHRAIEGNVRCIVVVGPYIKFVRRWESNASLGIKGKRQASHHLKVELIVLIQRLKVTLLNESACIVQVKSNAIVKVT